MSDAVWLKFLDQLPAILIGAGTFVTVLVQLWTAALAKGRDEAAGVVRAAAAAAIKDTNAKVAQIETNTNSLTAELVKKTADLSSKSGHEIGFAEGHLAGGKDEKLAAFTAAAAATPALPVLGDEIPVATRTEREEVTRKQDSRLGDKS